jgi:hypothetical protein
MCQQASNTYRYLTGPGDGYKWLKKPKQGVYFTPASTNTSTRKCYNCGKPGCIPSTCDQPRDEERIKRAAEAHKKSLRNKSGAANGGNNQKLHDGNNSGRRRRGKEEKDDLGHPMMKNKHGALVVDQKKLRASQDKSDKAAEPTVSKKALQQVESKLKKIEASLTASTSVSKSSTLSTQASAPAEVMKQVHEVQSLLAALTKEE